MKPKSIITLLLLLFVAGSLITLVVKESGEKTNVNQALNPTASSENSAPEPAVAGLNSNGEAPHRVIAYYFHGTARCRTCRTIEAYSKETLEAVFQEELGSGLLEWRVLNIEDPANEHFVQDYQLQTRTLVLADLKDGEVIRWKNLQKVWELVRDKEEFVDYIEEETLAYLKGDR
jgi:hypothetical protein